MMPAVMSTVRRMTSWPIAAVVPWTQTWLGILGKGPSRGAPLLTAAPLQVVQHWHPWKLSPSEYGGTGQTLPLLCIPLHEDHVTWRGNKHEDHVTWRGNKHEDHVIWRENKDEDHVIWRGNKHEDHVIWRGNKHEDHVIWRGNKHEDHVIWRRDKLPIHLT